MVEQQVRPWDVLGPARVLGRPRLAAARSLLRRNPPRAGLTPTSNCRSAGERSWKPVLDGRALQARCRPRPSPCWRSAPAAATSPPVSVARARGDQPRTPRRPRRGARARIDALGFGQNIAIETADAFAWDNDRRFDAICVGGAVDAIPARFLQWLNLNGRMFVVRGRSPAMEAVRVDARNGVNDARIQSLFETELPLPRRGRPGFPPSSSEPGPRMRRLPLAFALAAALSPARRRPRRRPDADLPAGAPERSAIRRRRGQPRGRRRESGAGARGAAAADRRLGGVTRSDLGPGSSVQTGSWASPLNQSLFDYGNYTALRGAKALDRAGGYDLKPPARPDHPYLGRVLQRAGATGNARRSRSQRGRAEEAVRPRQQAPRGRPRADHRRARGARAVRRRARQHHPDPQHAAGRLPGAGADHRHPGRRPQGACPTISSPRCRHQRASMPGSPPRPGRTPACRRSGADLEAAEANVATARSATCPRSG